jgi:CubicO group peptidase (beta-lactamase class C family)
MAAHLPRPTLASSLHSPQSFLGNLDAQVADNIPFHPAFDSFVDSLMSDWRIPGLAIAVVHENKTWSKVTTPLVLYKHKHVSVARLW